jgi:flagellin
VGTEASSRVDVSTYDVESQFSSSGLFAVDFTDPAALSKALDAIDASLSTTGSLQAEYGAQQNAFSGRVDSLLTAQENEQAARSRIRDTDFAATISEQIVQRVLEQASVSVQAQANVSNNRALNLLTS